MNEQELEIAKETVRLLRDYPELSYPEAQNWVREIFREREEKEDE